MDLLKSIKLERKRHYSKLCSTSTTNLGEKKKLLQRQRNEVPTVIGNPRANLENGNPNSNGLASDNKFSRDNARIARKNLPIFCARNVIIRDFRAHDNIVLMSETGSGKTTQIPQYILESGLAKQGIIACTQPRRIAAITVAERVSLEKNSEIGRLVGYTVRFEDVTSDKTKIKYLTDGMLLREAIVDPLLKNYSFVVLDEAHERTVHTDVLFGVVKSAQRQRKRLCLNRLSIVIMSATLDADHFAQYFNKAKVLFVEGRNHPIRTLYSAEPQTDYLHAALVTSLQLHKTMDKEPRNDILIFMTGQEEIDSLRKLIIDCSSFLDDDLPQLLVCPLFAALPAAEQLKSFTTTPIGFRKIILATNIAETSVTIPGVKCVIDTGMVKAKAFNAATGFDMLRVQPVSKAQARQRAGRAGREGPGVCYRLYTETSFGELQKDSTPEIQRCCLASVVLQLLALGIKDIINFDFMDPPEKSSLTSALEQLQLLGAIEPHTTNKLTQLGSKMAAFPLDPALSRVILTSVEYGCSEEAITIVSLLSVESITFTPSDMRDKARTVQNKFASSEGDLIFMLNIYRAFKHAKENRDWCSDHFINPRAMKTVMLIRKQLREICVRLHLNLASCGKDTTLIRQAFASGLFLNSAERQLDGTYIAIGRKETVAIHPSSMLFRANPAYVIFNELIKTSKCYMRGVSIVDPQWLVDASPDYFKKHKI